MRAYAIHAGGGVKGAALAGCLHAAEQNGIRFLGHGGTSAGSMVAVLAAVGYTGAELRDLLVDQLDFRDLLEDRGIRLQQGKQKLDWFAAQLTSKSSAMRCWAALAAIFESCKLGSGLGLYPGQKLKDFLLGTIRHKRPELAGHADITFEHLARAKCLPVKIVASDLTRRRPALFSRDRTEYGASVIDAVRASACFPLVFTPVYLNGHYLADGGLSSNLPVFLFAEEYRQSRVPTLAFDLIAPPAAGGTDYNLVRLGRDLYATALEASDDQFRQIVDGVFRIPVKTPADIGTLDFALTADQRRRLFDAGHQAVTDFLASWEPLKRARVAGSRLVPLLQADYGQPQFFAPVLQALTRDIAALSPANSLRAYVMLPTGRPEASLIVTYHHGMEGDTDSDLELPEMAGCSGRAWANRRPTFADLSQIRRDPVAWGMAACDGVRIPASRQSMLSVPIHDRISDGREVPMPVGVLSIDSVSPLAETGWVETTSHGPLLRSDVTTVMVYWASIIHKLLN